EREIGTFGPLHRVKAEGSGADVRASQRGCTDPLGMESGAIPDDSITASTFWGVGYEPYRGRLNGVAGNGAWAVTTSTIGEWLQVDLGEKKPVTGTIIQGRYYYDQWVTSYKLQYSVDGRSWIKYASSVGSEKVFPGNTDRNTPVTNLLDRPIDARYVRFLPQSWHGYIRMRVEVLGCTFKADNNNTFTCHRCQPGHACKLGDEQEDICPAGKVSNDNRTMCVPCAAGEFSSAPGAEACQKCPAGKYSTGGGSTSCLDCPAGKYSEAVGSTGCKVCPAGQYSSTAGSDGCTDCPAGQYSSTAGSDGCTDCSAGQYSSTAGSDGCTNCPAGQYSSTAGSDGCTNCPAGQYSSTAGSDGCTDCPAGQYSDAAESTGCKVCPVGKFSDAARSTGCKDCPAGQYSSRVGSNRCAYCPAGQYSSSGSNGCTDCPVGRYSNARGSMTCTNCRAGYYNAATRSTSCTACPPRTYSSREGLTHCSDCHYGSTTTGYGKSSCTGGGLRCLSAKKRSRAVKKTVPPASLAKTRPDTPTTATTGTTRSGGLRCLSAQKRSLAVKKTVPPASLAKTRPDTPTTATTGTTATTCISPRQDLIPQLQQLQELRDSCSRFFGQWITTHDWSEVYSAPTAVEKCSAMHTTLLSQMDRFFPLKVQALTSDPNVWKHLRNKTQRMIKVAKEEHYNSKSLKKENSAQWHKEIKSMANMSRTDPVIHIEGMDPGNKLDYSKAFDRVCHTTAIRRLLDLGLRPSLARWIANFLSNRRYPTWSVDIHRLLYINGAARHAVCKRWKFVDELTLLEVRHPISAPSNIQKDLTDLENWSNDSHMRLHPAKCKVLHILFSKVPCVAPPLSVNGIELQQVQGMKILGVFLQSNLRWNSHVDSICCKSSQRLFLLRKLKHFHISSEDLVTVYVSYIRPVLEYAAPVWHSGLTTELSNKVEKIQRRAVRIIMSAKYTSYTEGWSYLGLPTLQSRRLLLTVNFANSLRQSEQFRHFLPPVRSAISGRQTRSAYKLNTPRSRTDRYQNSALPFMIRLLNM
ncbi:hypothetical protein Bbelb_053950, partial [Branchiostoma belcheri]